MTTITPNDGRQPTNAPQDSPVPQSEPAADAEHKRMRLIPEQPEAWSRPIADPFQKAADDDGQRTARRSSLRWTAALVFAAGMLLAAIAYVYAPPDDGDIAGYEMANGQSFATTLQDSKRYRHDIELFGGKAALLADDFSRWLSSLWHGKALAGSIASLTLVGVAICLILDRRQRR